MLWLAPIALAAPNVVLVSLDTTRADALSCYGIPAGPYRVNVQTTPHIDAIAAKGARFERFFAHAPSTLSSHASMFTGLDPHAHGVVRNGYPVDAAIPTLAEVLSANGFDTIGVVASAALERVMGLDRGFRVYDDTLPVTEGGRMLQAPADDVVRRALAAVDGRDKDDKPLFLFVHFYDPHAPYAPPERFVSAFTDPTYRGDASVEPARFRALVDAARAGTAEAADLSHIANLYLGEVAFVDEQVGVLMSGLSSRGLLEETLVILTADHGETLSDEPLFSWSHGSNVGVEVMRIPLIVRGYGVPLAEQAVVTQQAGMSSLGATVEALVGLPSSLGGAIPFTDSLRAGPVAERAGWPQRLGVPVYVEATRPRQVERTDGWNNLAMHRGVWIDGRGAYAVPYLDRPMQPYDWGASVDPSLLALMTELVAAWDRRAPPHKVPVALPSTEAALKALGYTD